MSFQEDVYDKIEAYLSGQLDSDQFAAFEIEISLSESLQLEIEKHKTVNALIVEQRLLSVKDILHAEQIKGAGSRNSYNRYLYTLLTIAVVGVGSYVLMETKDADLTPSSAVLKTDSVRQEKNNVYKSAGVVAEKQGSNIETIENGFRKSQIQFVEQQKNELVLKGAAQDTSIMLPQTAINNTSTFEPNVNTVSVPKVKIIENPCANVQIQASVKTTATCIEEETGTVLVHSIQGGKKPYAIALRSSTNEAITNGALPKGIYEAVVSDANGCIQTYSNLVVAEKNCPKDYSFNPYIGEEWSLAAYTVQGQLEIHNKAGLLYYQATIQAQNAVQWSGMGLSNQIVPGYYIFVIKYSDGTFKRGSVTIVQ